MVMNLSNKALLVWDKPFISKPSYGFTARCNEGGDPDGDEDNHE